MEEGLNEYVDVQVFTEEQRCQQKFSRSGRGVDERVVADFFSCGVMMMKLTFWFTFWAGGASTSRAGLAADFLACPARLTMMMAMTRTKRS